MSARWCPAGARSSRTRIVIRIATTPSVKASIRAGFTARLCHGRGARPTILRSRRHRKDQMPRNPDDQLVSAGKLLHRKHEDDPRASPEHTQWVNTVGGANLPAKLLDEQAAVE